MANNNIGDRMEFLLIFVRTLFFYFFIFVVYRIMGKREVGQLGIIDLIVSILIAELVIISIENYDNNMMMSIIPILTLLFLQVTLAFVALRSPKFRIFLDGNPSVIIKDGKVNYNEMIKQKYNLDDLLVQLREKGYMSIMDVSYAILESNGTLSVFPNNKKKNDLPLPLILDSKIQRDTLKLLGKNENWVFNMIAKKGIKLDDIFYAFYKGHNLFVIRYDELV